MLIEPTVLSLFDGREYAFIFISFHSIFWDRVCNSTTKLTRSNSVHSNKWKIKWISIQIFFLQMFGFFVYKFSILFNQSLARQHPGVYTLIPISWCMLISYLIFISIVYTHCYFLHKMHVLFSYFVSWKKNLVTVCHHMQCDKLRLNYTIHITVILQIYTYT